MDKLKRKWRSLPLRTFFMLTVLITFSMVFLLSGLIIWGCAAFRHYLLPDSDSVYLSIQKTYEDGGASTESHLIKLDGIPVSLPQMASDPPLKESQDQAPRYSIEQIVPSYQRLTPKRKLAYTVCGITMVAAPAALSLAGIILCSFYFYRRKLKLPLQLLSDATVQIAAQNLDFRLEYDCEDEMGSLCRSFVQMQDTLCANNRKMWAMLEERKMLQASVSHDLRNPIAIIQGYAEHLENKAEKGNLSSENALHIARNISLAARRMENYAHSLHTLNQLEDITAKKLEISALRLSADLAEDFALMARQNHRTLHVSCGASQFHAPAGNPAWAKDCSSSRGPLPAGNGSASKTPVSSEAFPALPDIPIQADSALIYRILENIIGNALRFSRKDIFLTFSLESRLLSVSVRDDGDGFPDNILQKNEKSLLSSVILPAAQESHMGIGIAVSRILCHKHGGSLRLSNSPLGGAMAEVSFDVS